MTIFYTAVGTFDKSYGEEAWNNYIKLSKLNHVTEIVSLDGMLNELLVEHDPTLDWDDMVLDGDQITDFFKTLDFVLHGTKSKERFNLLAVVIEPTQNCKALQLEGFDFIGYDLLDKDYCNSALTNCGGFREFSSSDQNQYGLIDEYEKAYDIKEKLHKNNPKDHHADTNVIAVWRHKTLGRQDFEII